MQYKILIKKNYILSNKHQEQCCVCNDNTVRYTIYKICVQPPNCSGMFQGFYPLQANFDFSFNVDHFFLLTFKASLRCWSEVFRLHFDPVTETNRNAPGVEVRVPGWGDTHVVEMIDPSWSAWIIGNRGSYAQPLIEGNMAK